MHSILVVAILTLLENIKPELSVPDKKAYEKHCIGLYSHIVGLNWSQNFTVNSQQNQAFSKIWCHNSDAIRCNSSWILSLLCWNWYSMSYTAKVIDSPHLHHRCNSSIYSLHVKWCSPLSGILAVASPMNPAKSACRRETKVSGSVFACPQSMQVAISY